MKQAKTLFWTLCVFGILAGCGRSGFSDALSSAGAHASAVKEPISSVSEFGISPIPGEASPAVTVPPAQTPEPVTPAPVSPPEDSEDELLPHEKAPAAKADDGSPDDTEAEETPLTDAEELENPEVPAADTPTAAEAAPAENTLTELSEILESQLNGYDGIWSLYLKRLDTGESVSIYDTPMVAASLIKLYVYGTVWEMIDSGELSYDSCADALYSMINVSSNDACNSLIDQVGGMYAVNDFIGRYGFSSSELNRKMLSGEPVENYTSPYDCARVLEMVLSGTYVSAECSSALLQALRDQVYTEKIPSGVPYGVATANKDGELSDVENDAAIVFGPSCTYILCVMSDDVYLGIAMGEIIEISETVYHYLNP